MEEQATKEIAEGTLYGVGVGVGDPKLLTLQAIEILQQADIIAVPDTGGDHTALQIVSTFVEEKAKIFCQMPMTKNQEILQKCHRESADQIISYLKLGKSVAFITLGDPSIYSTYMYLHRLVQADGFSVRMIPGVPSFCAAAAALNISLCDGGQALHIISASDPNVENLLSLEGTKVLMKSGKNLSKIKENLNKSGLLKRSQMVECCSMEKETIYRNLQDAPNDSSYFSLIIVK